MPVIMMTESQRQVATSQTFVKLAKDYELNFHWKVLTDRISDDLRSGEQIACTVVCRKDTDVPLTRENLRPKWIMDPHLRRTKIRIPTEYKQMYLKWVR